MKKRRGPMTAGDLMAELEADPEFVVQRKGRDRVFAERAAQHRIEEKPFLIELRKVLPNVQSVWDLVNTSDKYVQAIPFLVEHLQCPYPDRVRGGIARALAVREASDAWPILVAEYGKTSIEKEQSWTKDGLAVALSVTATDAVMEELVEIVKDRSHGGSRVLLLSALKKSKSPLAKQALEELASDPELSKEIASWRRR